MFRSLFTKYITAFMLIIVVSFTILAAIIGSLLVNYATESKRVTVVDAASTVGFYLEKEYPNKTPDAFSAVVMRENTSVRRSLSIISHSGDLGLILTDVKGTVLVTDDGSFGTLSGQTVPQDVISALSIDKPTTVGDLGGMLPVTCICAGVPIGSDGTVLGYIFAVSDEAGTSDLIRTMNKAVLMACLWVLLAALIAVYFISERIISPLKDMSRAAKSFAQGNFDVRIPVTGRDEVAELATAFNSMATDLESLEVMRRSFIANVSHELRTPMTSIAGFIDSMLAGAIPADQQEHYLKTVSDEVHRLSRLVSSLLDITRIQAGERKFNKTTFDVCEMARQILFSFEQPIEEKHLDVEFDCEEDNLFVYADRDAIYQILYNICHNAVKFSREGGKYRIRLLERDKKVYTSVFNEGVGIPEADLPFVFDRFYKSDKSRGLDKTGVGLGLYIAKTVIDAHGEEIWVKSTYGENCEFVFTLPRVHDPKPERRIEGEQNEIK
ncbi:MAG: cell wall metabolism sensor histidine kinase WalK [Lachnospiraceae bacterium]|nr:cell wall metabolism sensor histidine kinase WalK [Lachnospiraceae bacterium]